MSAYVSTLTDVSLYVFGPCLVIIALARSSEPPSTFGEADFSHGAASVGSRCGRQCSSA